jgi:PTH1 family peptidyl-tRNA hydrolase
MKLVVGLGNPGSEYEETRHNAGFKVIDLLGTEFSAQFRKKNHVLRGASYDYAKIEISKQEVLLLKPLTYMNLSGGAVKAALDWFKISEKELIVLHDDVSLPLGKIRIQQGAGAGGQHGVESIIENLKGSKAFTRIKVGVGPDPGGATRHKFVLAPVREEDRQLYEDVQKMAKDAVKFILKYGHARAANKYNGKDLRELEESK